MKDFVIVLGGPPNGVFYPGWTVTGTVVCENSVPKKFKKIVLYFEGRADVSWAGTRSLQSIDACVNKARDHRVYISQSLVLWKKGNNGETLFPGGVQNLEFSFQLPQTTELPPSFNSGSFGSIKYFLEARITKDTVLKSDSVTSIPVKICNLVSIDHEVGLTLPVSMEVQKTLCCFCCASAPIVMTVRLPRKGFCIENDPIPVEVAIENGSFRRIKNIEVYIEKRFVYMAGIKSRSQSEEFGRVFSHSIRSHSSTVFQPNPIVPPVDNTPPTLLNCELVNIKYFLYAKAKIRGHSPMEVEIPLVLGNHRTHHPAVARVSSVPGVPSHYPTTPQSAYPPPAAAYPYPSGSFTLPTHAQNPMFNDRRLSAVPYNPTHHQQHSLSEYPPCPPPLSEYPTSPPPQPLSEEPPQYEMLPSSSPIPTESLSSDFEPDTVPTAPEMTDVEGVHLTFADSDHNAIVN